jgi:thioredoxin reductase (NADPH)
LTNKNEIYDLIIIGAGPAGLTAGTYASRLGLRTLILDAKAPGGRAVEAPIIENFPGFPKGITGNELISRMKEQVSKFGAKTKSFEEVVNLDFGREFKTVTTRKAKYSSLALIIATGTQRKKLRVPGETKFLGRGVSYCPLCDAPFFKGLRVAIVGNAEEAVTDALFLADLAKEVLLITHEGELEIADLLKRKLLDKDNVNIVNGKVTAILGENVVKAVKIAEFETMRERQEKVDGVFISLGGVPMTEIVRKAGIEVDERGCIKVNRWQKTNVNGVFAAGDCTCGGMQIVTSAGEGAMAAIKASMYIKKRKRKG